MESKGFTLAQMETLCNEAVLLKEKIKDAEEIVKKLKEQLEPIKAQFLLAMEEAGLKSFKGSGGRIELRESFYITIPETPEGKEQMYRRVREKYGDEFMRNKMSINSNSLQALVNESVTEALESGDMLSEVFDQELKTFKQIRII